jgi:colanic acid/amylovoran biosynthesis glycosyltransferase
MSRFPRLTETFILREMSELEKAGLSIILLPLIHERQSVVHEEAKPWLDRAQFTPLVSRSTIESNTRLVVKQPALFLRLIWQTIIYNIRSPKFFTRALFLLPKAIAMAEKCQKLEVEHIHAHFATHPAYVAWVIHQITGITYSVTAHAHDIYVDQTMLDIKLGQAAFIFTISDFNRRFLIKRVDSSLADKIIVAHCGVRPEAYVSDRPSKTPWTKRPFEILSIGSLQPYKGFLYLIEACKLLELHGYSFHCHIIGEGEERRKIEAKINIYDLSRQVTLHGALPQETVTEWFHRADCYVQPSIIASNKKMEGIPVSIMEAMASGLPVVASDISGIPELVRPGETGWLVPEKKPKAIADAIEYIYDHPEKASTLAAQGQEFVNKEFNLFLIIPSLANRYRNI